MIRRLVIFGASGDLTSRYLVPALVRLHVERLLPRGFEVLGVARQAWDTAGFRRHIAARLASEAGLKSESVEAVVAMLQYRQADVTTPEDVAAALGRPEEAIIAYLALPPALFVPTIDSLAALDLPSGSRIVIEKPFGEGLASAEAINRHLHRTFPERAVFRVDHFLGMQTVQNILGLRFANRVFEPLWSCEHIERVEIVWDETLTLEGRASYYDAAGALRDMLQNHLLQLLCLVGMEAPATLDEAALRDRKVELLRTVRRLTPEDVQRRAVRARYGAGKIGDRPVPAYVEEDGVEPERGTETFAQVTLFLDNRRWAGVPFTLRSGKAMRADHHEIAIHFKPVPHLAFGQAQEPRPNVLRLLFDPDGMALDMNINGPGDPFDLEAVELGTTLRPQEIPEYGRVLLDVLRGDVTLSIRGDEAEESWRIFEPVLDAWARGEVPLRQYAAGSDGPMADTRRP